MNSRSKRRSSEKLRGAYAPWRLSDFREPNYEQPTVLSTFACGGGSSMGYKLAEFRVVGNVEIDPRMAAVYEKNLKPQRSWVMDIRDFNRELETGATRPLVDVLDGSPPCSTFSMAGSREKAWGVEKKFSEGQSTQRLDDLFFHFIRTAELLRPKVVVSENVKGMLFGNARGYVAEIVDEFKKIGYGTQVFLLNGAKMGVPQRRERVFFVCSRSDLKFPRLWLEFNGNEIPASQALAGAKNDGKPLPPKSWRHWKEAGWGGLFSHCGADTGKLNRRLHPKKPAWTLTAANSTFHWDEPRWLSAEEVTRISSFPEDYDFGDQNAAYICGMSVPPYMMRGLALEIRKQWLSRTDKLVSQAEAKVLLDGINN